MFECFWTVLVEVGVENSGFDVMCSISYVEGESASHHHTASAGGAASILKVSFYKFTIFHFLFNIILKVEIRLLPAMVIVLHHT